MNVCRKLRMLLRQQIMNIWHRDLTSSWQTSFSKHCQRTKSSQQDEWHYSRHYEVTDKWNKEVICTYLRDEMFSVSAHSAAHKSNTRYIIMSSGLYCNSLNTVTFRGEWTIQMFYLRVIVQHWKTILAFKTLLK